MKTNERNYDYQDFCNVIKEKVENLLPDAEIEMRSVRKNNGLEMIGLVIKTESSNMAPTVYLDPYYEEYCIEVTDLDEIASRIVEVYASAKVDVPFDISNLNDDNIICEVINTSSNKGWLETIPHIAATDDYSIIFKWELPMFGADDSIGTVTITNDLAKSQHLDVEYLLEKAMANMPERHPATLKSMFDVLSDMLDSSSEELPDVGMYVLSNAQNHFGATTLFYPGTLEMLSKRFTTDRLVVIPSSIHELILIPGTDMDVEDMNEMVREVNATQLKAEEILGEHVNILVRNEAGKFVFENEDDYLLKFA